MHAEICNQLSHAAFLGFAKLHAGASNPELRLVSDLELVKRFFHYLEVRCIIIYTYIFARIYIYIYNMLCTCRMNANLLQEISLRTAFRS